MSADRTKTIIGTQWLERTVLFVFFLLWTGVMFGNTALRLAAAAVFIWIAVLFVLEALWAIELQLEEIKERMK